MVSLADKLSKDQTVDERATILKDHLSSQRDLVEQRNRITILDTDLYEGLRIGDLVSYVSTMGKPVQGYVSHFCQRNEVSVGLNLAKTCENVLVEQGEKELPPVNNFAVTPVMVQLDYSGYSTHHGSGLPELVNKEVLVQ